MHRTRNSFVAAFIGVLVAISAPVVEAQSSADAPSMAITFGSVGINVADIAQAEKFYTDVFGLVRTFQFPPEGDPIEVGLGRPEGGGMGLLLARLDDRPLPEGKSRYGRIVIMTDDARALADRAITHGSTLLRDLGSPGGPVILFMSDLDGYEFELYQAPSGGE